MDPTTPTIPLQFSLHDVLKDTVAPLVIGHWISIIFSTIFFGLVLRWYDQYWKKEKWLKILILGAVLNELAAMIITSERIYTLTVINWGDPAVLATYPWETSINPVFLGNIAIVLHLFLLDRLHRLIQKIYISVPLLLGVLFCWASSVRLVVTLFTHKHWVLFDPPKIYQYVLTWLIATSVVDILLAFTLTGALLRVRVKVISANTNRMIKNLIILGLQTGLISAIIQIATLIAYTLKSRSAIVHGLSLGLRSIYGIVFLHNLLIRTHLITKRKPTCTCSSRTCKCEKMKEDSKNDSFSRSNRPSLISRDTIRKMAVTVCESTTQVSDRVDTSTKIQTAAEFYRQGQERNLEKRLVEKDDEQQGQHEMVNTSTSTEVGVAPDNSFEVWTLSGDKEKVTV